MDFYAWICEQYMTVFLTQILHISLMKFGSEKVYQYSKQQVLEQY
jgi:hypothetical protein